MDKNRSPRFRKNFRYDFSIELFDAVESQSTTQIFIKNQLLKTGSTYNDFDGFGTSLEKSKKDAQKYFDDMKKYQCYR